MLSKEDRIAFSLQIVSAPETVKALDQAKAQLQGELVKLANLDNANKNLLAPGAPLIVGYQNELQYLNGQVRTVVTEQDIINAAKRQSRNFFFPNDTATSVPSLASANNVWTKIPPFALNYAIGKKYNETYDTFSNNELDLIALINSYTEYIPAPPSGTPIPTVIATVNTYLATLALELAAIVTDPDPVKQAQNAANANDINTVIIPALNSYLSVQDLLVLQTAVTTRGVFVNTRISQINANLGTISQDLSSGAILSSSGLYGQRYGFLALRLNSLNGSLSKASGLGLASDAQTAIKADTIQTAATYMTICPASLLSAPASGTAIISLVDASFLNVGDSVWVVAEGQEELQRAVKAINGKMVTLNDIIPSKYRPIDKARIYKDLT